MTEGIRFRSASLAVVGLTAVGVAVPVAVGPIPILVYNASASAPPGFYRRAIGPLRRGDFVLARLPDSIARFAADRGYLPRSVPLIKRVAAVSGDRVCVESGTVRINGKPMAIALDADAAGRPLATWTGCRLLPSDEVFLLMPDVPASLDGRYFGPLPRSAIIERLVPLWTW